MGWDATASPVGSREVSEFLKISEKVHSETGAVDGFLSSGALDCSACGKALERATGAWVWDMIMWDSHKVKEISESAKWSDTPDWAEASARAFLETCAKLGLSITFS